jgi:hypothetical protein
LLTSARSIATGFLVQASRALALRTFPRGADRLCSILEGSVGWLAVVRRDGLDDKVSPIAIDRPPASRGEGSG